MACHFYLNDREVRTAEPAGMLVLDFLRHRAQLTGTKEGCREGDCGACVVLVGEQEEGRVVYKPVTACLMPLGELHGKHLVSVEGLCSEALSPVQQALVDEGATQCGFCTPGIVVSLTGYLMETEAAVNLGGIKTALGGHLCRCTGYRSLKASARHLSKAVGAATGVAALVGRGMLPAYFLEMPDRLRKIAPPLVSNGQGGGDGGPEAGVFIAGGTDLYVQQGETLPEASVQVLNHYPAMKHITREDGCLRVGALTTFEDFARHAEVIRLIPAIQDYMVLIASWQIRNRATLGGNVVNASPIGDMTILLLALETDLVLQDGKASRTVPITQFYQGYK
jgi:xanthine dehydrogenase small subunit